VETPETSQPYHDTLDEIDQHAQDLAEYIRQWNLPFHQQAQDLAHRIHAAANPPRQLRLFD
jgi:hypothetical protein